MQKILKYEFIEVAVPYNSGATRFNVPDQPNLRFKQQNALVTYNATDMPNSVLSGNQLPTAADFAYATLVLYANDKELINRIPLYDLHSLNFQSSGVFERNPFAGQTIVWSKSYVLLSQPLTWGNYTGAVSFCFGVYYN